MFLLREAIRISLIYYSLSMIEHSNQA